MNALSVLTFILLTGLSQMVRSQEYCDVTDGTGLSSMALDAGELLRAAELAKLEDPV